MDAYFDANLYNDIERADIPPDQAQALKAARARAASGRRRSLWPLVLAS
jgi:hypothetical protein